MCVLATIRTDTGHLGRTAMALPLLLIWGLVSPPTLVSAPYRKSSQKAFHQPYGQVRAPGRAGWSEGRQKDRVWVVLVKKTGRCLFKDLITFSVMGSPGSLKCHSSEAMGCHTRRRRGLWDWEIWNRTASKPNLKAQHFHFALLVKWPSNQALMQCLFHSIKNQDLHKHLHAVLI